MLLHLPASVQAWAQQQWAKHFSVETFDKLSHKKQKELEGKVLCPASPECLDGLEAELINAGYERNDEHPAPSCFCPLCARQWELDDAARLEKERKEAERKEAAARREAEKERKEEAAKQRRDAAAAAAAERAQKEADKRAAAAAKGKAVGGSSEAQMAAARGQRISWDAGASDEEDLFSPEELAAGKSSFRGGGNNKAPAPNQLRLMQGVWERARELRDQHQQQLGPGASRQDAAAYFQEGARQAAVEQSAKKLRQEHAKTQCTCRAPLGCFQGLGDIETLHQLLLANIGHDTGAATMQLMIGQD